MPERRRLLLLLSGSALLAACGGPRLAQREEPRDPQFAQFAGRGYDPAAATTTYPFRESWPHGNEEVVVELLLPRGNAQVPLVIYLPGLGEAVEAGETWRAAWAQDG